MSGEFISAKRRTPSAVRRQERRTKAMLIRLKALEKTMVRIAEKPTPEGDIARTCCDALGLEYEKQS